MFCKNCGVAAEGNVKFCSECGNSLLQAAPAGDYVSREDIQKQPYQGSKQHEEMGELFQFKEHPKIATNIKYAMTWSITLGVPGYFIANNLPDTWDAEAYLATGFIMIIGGIVAFVISALISGLVLNPVLEVLRVPDGGGNWKIDIVSKNDPRYVKQQANQRERRRQHELWMKLPIAERAALHAAAKARMKQDEERRQAESAKGILGTGIQSSHLAAAAVGYLVGKNRNRS